MEQAARVSVSPGGSAYLQPSAAAGNNTCIGLPPASHLTSWPHYNYEQCNPAGELSPAGNGCPGVGGLQGAHVWEGRGGGESSALLSRRGALCLGMKMQDPALPTECWVSIVQRCSITAIYLCASSLSRRCLISDHRQTRSPTDDGSVCDPGRGRAGGCGGGGAWLLKFSIFAFDCHGHSSDALNVSHLANLRQGQRERHGVVYSGGRQAVIYGAVGHLSPLDPTPTQ